MKYGDSAVSCAKSAKMVELIKVVCGAELGGSRDHFCFMGCRYPYGKGTFGGVSPIEKHCKA